MANRNKEIGKSFEREVCDAFHKATGLNFQRVPNSGSFIGGRNVVRMDTMSENQIGLMRGDIIPPKEYPNLIIECKKRKSFSFHLLFHDDKDLNSWIKQVEVDFNAGGKGIWLLVFKVNNRGMYVVWNGHRFKLTCTDNSLIYQLDHVNYLVHRFDERWLAGNLDAIRTFSA